MHLAKSPPKVTFYKLMVEYVDLRVTHTLIQISPGFLEVMRCVLFHISVSPGQAHAPAEPQSGH